MNETTRTPAPTLSASSFNFNKLQAALCMGASAAVSIGLLAWAICSWA